MILSLDVPPALPIPSPIPKRNGPTMPAIISEHEWTQEAIDAMRDWLLDCYNDDDSQDNIRECPPAELIRAVRLEYDGGLSQFLSDAGLV